MLLTTPHLATTTNAPRIPATLQARIDKYYKATYRKLKTYHDRCGVPPIVTKHVLADLRALINNDYRGWHVTPDDLLILGTTADFSGFLEEGGEHNSPIFTLYNDYALFGAIRRLRRLRLQCPIELKPIIAQAQERKERCCGAVVEAELKRCVGEHLTPIEAVQASLQSYTCFLITAAIEFKATASELGAVAVPTTCSQLLNAEQNSALAGYKEELIGQLLAVSEYTIQSIEEQQRRVDKRRREMMRGQTGAPSITANDDVEVHDEAGSATTDQRPKTADLTAASAATNDAITQATEAATQNLQRKVITLYQSNTSTLSKPLEALKTAPAVIENVGTPTAYRNAKAQPLNAIITALADKAKISPTRVTQLLQALPIIAQQHKDKLVGQTPDGNFSIYKLPFTTIADTALGYHANGAELRELALATDLASTLKIGNDEKRIVGYKKNKSGQRVPIVKTYREYTQLVNVPTIGAFIDDNGALAGPVEFTLYVHRLITTGKRTDKLIDADNQHQRIADPYSRLVTIDEIDLARQLFKSDDGIRFYNTLISCGHIKEPSFMASVFNYSGQIAAAEQQAAALADEADEKARKAKTQAEADALRADAKAAGDKLIAARRRSITANKSRDRQRLYGWLDAAVDNMLIKPYTITDATDGSKGADGKPTKVIAWSRFAEDKD